MRLSTQKSTLMTISKASLALEYFETCLINPRLVPGTQNSDLRLTEISYEYSAGFKDLAEVSEMVGEIIGASLANLIIGLCINTITQENEKCSRREIRKLEKSLRKVYDKKDALIKSWNHKLNLNLVAKGASRNLDYLLMSRERNSMLECEIEAAETLREYRFECLRLFSPGRLSEIFLDEINALIGNAKSI